MKVKLINVAEYEIKEDKVSSVPFNTFTNLCGGIGARKEEDLPKVRLFKTMGEFIALSQNEMMEIDQNENIRILNNGQFLVFLKKENNDTSSKDNATTDTKENTEK